jgi:uncharacterized membrane protein SirB2|tara:strand:- start:12 stop:209 length:198 start_codon:yes stop_codon:yes gene_type:complete
MGIFILGGIVFIVAFCLFKISAFRKTRPDESWLRISIVGIVDYIVLISGTIGTGILFMTLYNIGH